MADLVYFETSWSVMSSVSLINVFLGFLVIGITNLSALSVVPIVVSAASAVANGLCYYAFYAEYSRQGTIAAAAVADMLWMVEEAGLSFYSYFILIRVLRDRSRMVFLVLFWALMSIIVVLRILILVNRSHQLGNNTLLHQSLIDHLHIGYFICIAVVEILCAVLLLRKFNTARKTCLQVSNGAGVFRYLMRSTEVCLAGLALIGITRAATYSFQTTAQSATSVSGEVDRFVATMECMFPVVMFIDLIASKLKVATAHEGTSLSNTPASGHREALGTSQHANIYSMSNIETRVGSKGVRSSPQERMVGARQVLFGGISKTVGFEFHESAATHRY